jgi:hypothetical protein
MFFGSVQTIAHLAEAMDPDKIVESIDDAHYFIMEAQTVIQFLSGCTQAFIDSRDWEADYEEDEDDYEDEDE